MVVLAAVDQRGERMVLVMVLLKSLDTVQNPLYIKGALERLGYQPDRAVLKRTIPMVEACSMPFLLLFVLCTVEHFPKKGAT